jgi:hypothetical protein
VLFGREGIQNPSHGIHLFRNLRGRAPFRSFEKEMLDEVGDAILVMGLVTGTVFHPDPEAHRPMIRHLLRNHSNAVFQNRFGEHSERLSLCCTIFEMNHLHRFRMDRGLFLGAPLSG